MKEINFEVPCAKINYNGRVVDCRYVSFLKLEATKNKNGTLTVFPVFQNPVTGEVCTCYDEYPDFIKYMLDNLTLVVKYNQVSGEVMLWHSTIFQDCGLTTGDVILCADIDGSGFNKIMIYTDEAFRACAVSEED